MSPKDLAKAKISELVDRFTEQYDSYRKAEYNETQTRRDFIDPFFKALGWDIDNENGYAEAYREVIHEDRVKIGKATKAPDYSFRLSGGKRLFFVEAKKPSVIVKEEIQPAYQVRRYGWSAKLPVSIITDFEEFAVYDCNVKPSPTDKASVARVKYFTYKDYLAEFDFLWDSFSKERVLKGSFDKFIRSDKNKRGTTTVDKDFLESLDQWRTQIAVDVCKNNRDLNEDEINYIVQQTIDRLIFLRIAEDRGVEPYGRLKECLIHGTYYQHLFTLFQEADDKYNSGLFDFRKDKISKNVVLDNKVIKTIINQLYYPQSPYEFSVLSVEILGNAYEQFLGKQIKVSATHKAKIEEKPAVRKAGGVYYTPQFIVEYIVKNTVGKLVADKKPKDIEKLRILDPACGSGSFLIGVYQFLLDWHKQYYIASGLLSKGGKLNPLTPEGNLTTSEKKRILINNIYGVDIDSNAVEVTKLSLLLKCMEGETESSINTQLKLFNERILPSLENNIKSGNSLIETDFYSGQFEFEGERKIKPFNWAKAFPQIFDKGKFDVVLGNPPYVLVSPELFSAEEISYFGKYEVAQYKVDLYHLFIEKGMKLLNKNGYLSFIVPSTWMTQQFTDKLRKYVLEKFSMERVYHLEFKVFDQADVYTEIIVIRNTIPGPQAKIEFLKADKDHFDVPDLMEELQSKFSNSPGYTMDIRSLSQKGQLAEKIARQNKMLSEVARASLGCQAYNSSKHSKAEIENRVFHSDTKKGPEYLEELAGNDVGRYLIERKKGQWIKYGSWLHDYRTMDWLTGPRILVREITGKRPYQLQAAYTEKTYCNYKTILNVSPSPATKLSMKYLCGLLNSKLLSFIFSHSSNKIEAKSFPRVSVGDLKKLPIRDIDFKNAEDVKLHNEIEKNVEMVLKLTEELKTATLPAKSDQLQHRLELCTDQIDKAVYKLYSLTDKEIKVVEGD